MIENWIQASSDKPKLLVIYGPTACGKTSLTIEYAKQYNGEVVNADSRQVYRGMGIGTGKVTEAEQQGIVHHMIDIRDISEMYGVGDFAPEARRIIADIYSRGKLPILSGGTGLFIDAVIADFTIPEVPADWGLRDSLEQYRLEHGDGALWQKLHDIDPLYAAELDPRNYRYVIRGIEVFTATGQSKKTLGKRGESPYDVMRITPFDGDRAALYERINLRVRGMFDAGLVEEVRRLVEGRRGKEEGQGNDTKNSYLGPGIFDLGPNFLKKTPGLNAIGYREILPYLAGEQSLDRTIELVQQNSRHYAKRQLTWFRGYQDLGTVI